MSVKSDRWIRRMALEHRMIEPFSDKQVRDGVISYGVSSYGYDVRIADEFKIFTNINSTIVDPKNFDPRSFVDFKGDVCIIPPNSFALARTVEYFRIPRNVLVVCVGKSYLRPLRDHRERHAAGAGVGGHRHPGGLEHHAPAREDLRQRGHRADAVLRERRGVRDLLRGQEGQVPGPDRRSPSPSCRERSHGPRDRHDGRPPHRLRHPAPGVRPDRGGGRRVRGAGVPRRQDQRRPVVRPPGGDRPRRPTPWTASWRASATWAPPPSVADARFAPAEADGILPDEFYSTTNFDTFVRVDGKWEPARDQKMDCALVLRDGAPHLREAGAGAAGRAGGPARARASACARPSAAATSRSSASCPTTSRPRSTRASSSPGTRPRDAPGARGGGEDRGGGGAGHRPLRRRRRPGPPGAGRLGGRAAHGNAFAAHDLEKSILKTSLGVCQMSGRAVEGGSRNHLCAINAVNRAGGIRAAVESGLVTSGVMYEAVKKGIPFVLAGSIRDDGPLQGRHHRHPGRAEGLRGGAAGRRDVPDAGLRPALHRGGQPAARARADGVRGHDGVGAGQAVQPRHHAGHRPGHRRRLLPGAPGGGAGADSA